MSKTVFCIRQVLSCVTAMQFCKIQTVWSKANNSACVVPDVNFHS